MGRSTTGATVHTCDGCGTSYIQLDGDDMPIGFYVEVFAVARNGADAGNLYVCKEKCLLPAFKRRTEVWSPQT
jgi:uncharacterized protein (DUF983 family)